MTLWNHTVGLCDQQIKKNKASWTLETGLIHKQIIQTDWFIEKLWLKITFLHCLYMKHSREIFIIIC